MQTRKIIITFASILILIVLPTENQAKTNTSQTFNKCSYIYGIHDEGLNDSQLIRYSAKNGIEPLGKLLIDHDIEALDISLEGVLYGAAGDNTDKPAYLYTFDMKTGAISSAQPTGCKELDGISFNPADGSLWGWDQVQGLVQIIDNTCLSIAANENTSTFEVEDLSWNNSGDTLYFVYNDHDGTPPDKTSDKKATHHIGQYHAGSVDWQVCDISISEMEALEVLNDGTLLIGYHNKNRQLVSIIDLQTCEMTLGEETVYDDIEGLAVCLPEPTPCSSCEDTTANDFPWEIS